MINQQLFNPESIIVVGASNDTTKPGGKLLKNLINTNYQGKLIVVNKNYDEVLGIKAGSSVAGARAAVSYICTAIIHFPNNQ